jgi:hypothetical protein
MRPRDYQGIFSKVDFVLVILAVAGIAGVVLVFLITSRGIGVGYDSLFYLSSAESLVRGLGLRWPAGTDELVPLVHYPPLYPLVLAIINLFGVDLVHAAKLLASILFGFNLFLIGFIIYRYTNLAFISLTAAFVTLASPVFLDIHLEAMSEPLFLAFLLPSLFLIYEYLKSGRRVFLFASAGVTSLACLTRYIGPSIIGAGIVSLLLLGSGSIKKRLMDCLIFAGISLIPLGIWYARNLILTGSATGRMIVYHPMTYASRRLGIETVAEWFVSHEVSYEIKKKVFISLGLGGLLLFCLVSWNEHRKHGYRSLHSLIVALRFPGMLVVFMAMYCLVLFLSLSFVDASTKLNDRILFPLYIAGVILLFCLAGLIFTGKGRLPLSRLIFLILIGALLWVFVERSIPLVIAMRDEGRGFTSRTWQASETVKLVREMDLDGAIYSTEALPIYFLTGKSAYSVPERADSILDQEIQNYTTKLDVMKRRLEDPGSALIIFSSSFHRVEMPSQSELVDGLVLKKQGKDGSIWVNPAHIINNSDP